MQIWIEIVALLIMAIGVGGFLMLRSQEGGVTRRALQFLAIVLIVPAILILALEGVLPSEATSALVGAIIGYALSGVGQRSRASAAE